MADHPYFSGNLDRVRNRGALNATLQRVFDTLTREAVIDKLDSARIAYGRISTLDDLASHPQNRYISVRTPGGEATMLSPGLTHDGAVMAALETPALGAHSCAIRSEFEK